MSALRTVLTACALVLVAPSAASAKPRIVDTTIIDEQPIERVGDVLVDSQGRRWEAHLEVSKNLTITLRNADGTVAWSKPLPTIGMKWPERVVAMGLDGDDELVLLWSSKTSGWINRLHIQSDGTFSSTFSFGRGYGQGASMTKLGPSDFLVASPVTAAGQQIRVMRTEVSENNEPLQTWVDDWDGQGVPRASQVVARGEHLYVVGVFEPTPGKDYFHVTARKYSPDGVPGWSTDFVVHGWKGAPEIVDAFVDQQGRLTYTVLYASKLEGGPRTIRVFRFNAKTGKRRRLFERTGDALAYSYVSSSTKRVAATHDRAGNVYLAFNTASHTQERNWSVMKLSPGRSRAKVEWERAYSDAWVMDVQAVVRNRSGQLIVVGAKPGNAKTVRAVEINEHGQYVDHVDAKIRGAGELVPQVVRRGKGNDVIVGASVGDPEDGVAWLRVETGPNRGPKIRRVAPVGRE